MRWERVAEGTKPFAKMHSSSHAELHAQRLGLICVSQFIAVRRVRITKKVAVVPGEAVKARRVHSRLRYTPHDARRRSEGCLLVLGEHLNVTPP